ncbi:MAG: cytochrome c biogenesis heme-transporting ATPase CcmA [Gammaproteobacteria bacterium]|nr:cytochrome c biogenesis heme-transporting ATPase CcmA [Gammaproteobacteria bacterium]
MPADSRLLQTDKLEIWRGDRPLIRDLDISAAAGEVIHLSGPNGSGKTTLLRCLAGLTLADAGTVSWFGRQFAGRPDPSTRARMQYLGHLDALKGGLTPVENLASLDALRMGERLMDIDAALDAAGVSHRRNIPCRFLSAGQKRRTGLARLLMRQAQVWLLDEPFTSLDVNGVAMVTDWIRAHAANGGLVILSTHQPMAEGVVSREIRLEGAQ